MDTLQDVPSGAKPVSRTLEQILSSIQERDRLLEEPTFDPKAFVGLDLSPEADLQALKAKVDGTAYVIEELEGYASRLEAKAEEAKNKARSAWVRAKALQDYVIMTMRNAGFERLPGAEKHAFRLVTHHTPSLVPLREPNANDAIRYPAFVEVIPRSYRWQKATIKIALIDGLPNIDDIAELKYMVKLKIEDLDQPLKKGKK